MICSMLKNKINLSLKKKEYKKIKKNYYKKPPSIDIQKIFGQDICQHCQKFPDNMSIKNFEEHLNWRTVRIKFIIH